MDINKALNVKTEKVEDAKPKNPPEINYLMHLDSKKYLVNLATQIFVSKLKDDVLDTDEEIESAAEDAIKNAKILVRKLKGQ